MDNSDSADLRSILENAVDAHQPPVESSPNATEAIQSSVNESNIEPANNAPKRDDSGKFAKKETVAPSDAAQNAQSNDANDANANVNDATQNVADNNAIKPPSSWKREAKAEFDKLPPLVQNEILRRESDFHKGIEPYKQAAQTANNFQKAIEPFMATIQALGVDAPTAVNKLLQADHNLRYGDMQTKATLFQQLARDYGVDLQHVMNPQSIDPRVAEMQRAMQQKDWELQNFRYQQAQAAQAQQGEAMNNIESFAASPENVHFQAVKGDMAILLDSGKAHDLQTAYDMAVWMRPDIRQTLLEQQRAEAQQRAIEQSTHARARTANVSIKGSSPAATGAQPAKGSLREQLEAAFADS
jgi:hypothetical protein